VLLSSPKKCPVDVIFRDGARLGEITGADPGFQSAIDIGFASDRSFHRFRSLQDDGQHLPNNTRLHQLVMRHPRDAFVDTTRAETPACVFDVGTVVLMGDGKELALSVKPHFRLQQDRVGIKDKDAIRGGASDKGQLEYLLLDPTLPICGDKFLHGREGPRNILSLISL